MYTNKQWPTINIIKVDKCEQQSLREESTSITCDQTAERLCRVAHLKPATMEWSIMNQPIGDRRFQHFQQNRLLDFKQGIIDWDHQFRLNLSTRNVDGLRTRTLYGTYKLVADKLWCRRGNCVFFTSEDFARKLKINWRRILTVIDHSCKKYGSEIRLTASKLRLESNAQEPVDVLHTLPSDNEVNA